MSRLQNPAIYSDARIPLLFAHRGYSSRAPENTIAAFKAARETGIPGIELDVHRCATGELVVIHDHDLMRLSGTEGIVERESRQSLRKLDVGSSFSEYFKGERIPLLDEVFAELGDSVYYDVEIKNRGAEAGPLERDLVDLIHSHGLASHTLVSSFNPTPIRMVKAIDPSLPTAIIYSSDRGVPLPLRHGEGRFISHCDVLKPSVKKIKPWPLFFNQMLMGYPIVTWTVDSPEIAARILKFNVTGIISNDPEPLLALPEYRHLRTVQNT
jgi:glycerophosphoryl diester phosphodiesterase